MALSRARSWLEAKKTSGLSDRESIYLFGTMFEALAGTSVGDAAVIPARRVTEGGSE